MKGAKTWSNYWRSPKTHQERKKVTSTEEQGIKVRSKRNVSHLPNAYDDISISVYKSRSWKDKTKCKHQWKEIKEQKCYNCRFWHFNISYQVGSCNIDNKNLLEKYGEKTTNTYTSFHPGWMIGEGKEHSYTITRYKIERRNTLAKDSCCCWMIKRCNYSRNEKK